MCMRSYHSPFGGGRTSVCSGGFAVGVCEVVCSEFEIVEYVLRLMTGVDTVAVFAIS